MKCCSRCKKEKELINFHKDKKTSDGLNYCCKECAIEMRNDYVQRNLKKVNDHSKNYYLLNKKLINDQKKLKRINSEKYKNKLIIKQIKEEKLKVQKNELNDKIVNFILCNNIKNEIVNSDIGNFILYNLLIEYNSLKNLGLNSVKLKYSWFLYNNYLKYFEKIFEMTKFLNIKNNVSISERIYCILFDIHHIIKCINCHKNVKYKQFTIGYEIHCGDKKCYIHLKGIIKDSNGLTANDKSQIALSDYLLNIDENGISNKDKRTMKIKKILESNIIDGLDGFERGFKNGAGKNSSIKYYNKDIYFQGSYEKNFLDIMTNNNLLDEVKRGHRICYINSADVECIYRSDFLFRDIIFEIKSNYTYGSCKYSKNENTIKILNEKRVNNNLKFKYTLLQGERIIIIFNKKEWIELNISMFDDLNIDIFSKKLNDLSNLDFNTL